MSIVIVLNVLNVLFKQEVMVKFGTRHDLKGAINFNC